MSPRSRGQTPNIRVSAGSVLLKALGERLLQASLLLLATASKHGIADPLSLVAFLPSLCLCPGVQSPPGSSRILTS